MASEINAAFEEYKLLVGSAVNHFDFLVKWYAFFFGFQLIAFGVVLKDYSPHDGKSVIYIISSIGFSVLHILNIVAVPVFLIYLNSLKGRLADLRETVGGSLGDPVQYSLYRRMLALETCGLSVMLIGWLALLGHFLCPATL
jgi:hypothetical protein